MQLNYWKDERQFNMKVLLEVIRFFLKWIDRHGFGQLPSSKRFILGRAKGRYA
jgi:hypothetical protein